MQISQILKLMCIHTVTETAGGSKKLGQSISVLDILKKNKTLLFWDDFTCNLVIGIPGWHIFSF